MISNLCYIFPLFCNLQDYMNRILCGLCKMHASNVVHKFLNPKNVLITKKKIKLSWSSLTPQVLACEQGFNSLWYRAPEVLLNAPRQTAAVDIWSVGCILMELLLKKPLWCGKGGADQLMLILQVSILTLFILFVLGLKLYHSKCGRGLVLRREKIPAFLTTVQGLSSKDFHSIPLFHCERGFQN